MQRNMFNILIVDDELLVRTHIKLLLQTVSDEFVVCGEATDGISALKQIPLLHPQIIFSDMKMPDMNGLELCQAVHEQYPEIRFIALSNYDDYTYVRGALKNGAIDYILKHKLNEHYLSSLLKELKKSLDTQIHTKAFPDNTISVLREKFILDLLGHVFLSEKDIDTNIKMLGISLELTNVVPIILSVDDYAKMEYETSLNQLNILNFSICNIGNEILSHYKTGIMAHIERETYCILSSFSYEVSQARINDTINSILHQLSSNYKNFLNISTSFCVGDMSRHIIDISHSYAKALDTMQLKFYSGKQSVLHSGYTDNTSKRLSGLDYSIEKNLLSLVSRADYEEINTIVKNLFIQMIEQKENRSNVQMICTDLLSIITRVSKKNNLDLNEVMEQKVSPDQIFTQLNTLMELCDWFLDCFQSICVQIRLQLPGDSNYVKSAIAYMNRDYSEPISLQSIAEAIGISIGYLSTIFKKETGQGFADYLNALRISSALHMLELGETDLHKIASECVFQDYAYFFKVFKKRTGTTPKTYIKNIL